MGAWFESKIMHVTKSTSKTDKTDKPTDNVKPVLSESSLKTSEINTGSKDNSSERSGESSKSKDENANEKSDRLVAMETDEGSTSACTDSGIPPYDKLFDFVKDDGFVYHIVYEGFV